MKLFAGIVVLASCMPYLVYGEAVAAAAATSGDGAAAAATSGDGAAAAATSGDGTAAAATSGDGTAAAATSRDGTAAAAATTTSTEPQYPPVRCICPLNYAPVCGSDGITYSNECEMRCVSVERRQRGGSTIYPLYSGPCKRYVCNCNNEYKPVCGTNNHTYTNECWLACNNRRCIENRVPTVGLAYRGPCSSLSCRCPNTLIPVCGTDGKTYRNVCILQCYSRLNCARKMPPIYVAECGACKIERCICPKKKDEVCASDNNTYYNKCYLECQNRRLGQLARKLLTIKHNGPCTLCRCPKIIDPVCANNDVTFDNECLFLCENNKRIAARENKLWIRWKGDCNCGCCNKWDPYCTTDGRTFPNLCLLDCTNRKLIQDGRKQLTATRGECKRCRCDYCPSVEQPVCDSLGNTHRNMCYFNCNNDCRAVAKLNKLCVAKFGRC